MSVTLATLRNDALLLLNEASNSVIGDLPDGTGGVTTASTAIIDSFINEAAAELARSCVYISGSGIVSNFSGTECNYASTSVWYPMAVHLVTVGAGSITRLTHTSELRARAWWPQYESLTSAVTLPNGHSTSSPFFWWRKADQKLYIFPSATNVDVNINGAILPPAITSDVSASFLPDDVLRNTLPVYAAMKLAMKNLDDPSLASRIQLWQTWWFDTCIGLYNRLDSSLKLDGGPYVVPPTAPPAAK